MCPATVLTSCMVILHHMIQIHEERYEMEVLFFVLCIIQAELIASFFCCYMC